MYFCAFDDQRRAYAATMFERGGLRSRICTSCCLMLPLVEPFPGNFNTLNLPIGWLARS